MEIVRGGRELAGRNGTPLCVAFCLDGRGLVLPYGISMPIAGFSRGDKLLGKGDGRTGSVGLVIGGLGTHIGSVLIGFQLEGRTLAGRVFVERCGGPDSCGAFRSFIGRCVGTCDQHVRVKALGRRLDYVGGFGTCGRLLRFHSLAPRFLASCLVCVGGRLKGARVATRQGVSAVGVCIATTCEGNFLSRGPFRRFRVGEVGDSISCLARRRLVRFIRLCCREALPRGLRLALTFFLFVYFADVRVASTHVFYVRRMGGSILACCHIGGQGYGPRPVGVPVPVPTRGLLRR